jgi:hypothetical protein
MSERIGQPFRNVVEDATSHKLVVSGAMTLGKSTFKRRDPGQRHIEPDQVACELPTSGVLTRHLAQQLQHAPSDVASATNLKPKYWRFGRQPQRSSIRTCPSEDSFDRLACGDTDGHG